MSRKKYGKKKRKHYRLELGLFVKFHGRLVSSHLLREWKRVIDQAEFEFFDTLPPAGPPLGIGGKIIWESATVDLYPKANGLSPFVHLSTD